MMYGLKRLGPREEFKPNYVSAEYSKDYILENKIISAVAQIGGTKDC